MKTIVLERNVHELELKPDALLAEYRSLLAQDVQARLIDPAGLRLCACPGCASERTQPAFEKLGLAYVECLGCGSVFVTPRPGDDALVAFYRDAPSARFWRECIGVETRDLRREKVFRPRAQWVLDTIDRHCPDATRVTVAGYHGDLLVPELIRQSTRPLRLVVTNPIADLEFRGVDLPRVDIRPTAPGRLGEIGPTDVFLAFDLLDRTSDVDGVFAAARRLLVPGGVLLASTTVMGFDLQVLWERAAGIYPPERLTLLSVAGLQALADRHGFDVVEFSTPGVFDVEVVHRAMAADSGLDVPRVIRSLLRQDESVLDALQDFLQQHRLSSFARLALRRRPS